jgi:hypothetical protein
LQNFWFDLKIYTYRLKIFLKSDFKTLNFALKLQASKFFTKI